MEHDDGLAFVLTKFLEIMGYNSVTRARTYKEALKLNDTFKPDILLIDIHLNDEKTGIDFVKEIRKMSPLPSIFLSSTTNKKEITEAKSIPNCEFLSKPYDFVALESLMRSVFTGKGG